MKCEYCGNNITTSMSFCASCGMKNDKYVAPKQDDVLVTPAINNAGDTTKVETRSNKGKKGRKITVTLATILAFVFAVVGAIGSYINIELFSAMEGNDLAILFLIIIVILFSIIGVGGAIVSLVFSIVGIVFSIISFTKKHYPVFRFIICIICAFAAIATIAITIVGFASI